MFGLWDAFHMAYENDARRNKKIVENRSEQNYKDAHREILRLESKIDGLALTCQSLWEIIRDETHLTDQQVLEKITEIDERDGRADNRMTGKKIMCTSCDRPGHTRQKVCMYCGSVFSDSEIFKT